MFLINAHLDATCIFSARHTAIESDSTVCVNKMCQRGMLIIYYHV